MTKECTYARQRATEHRPTDESKNKGRRKNSARTNQEQEKGARKKNVWLVLAQQPLLMGLTTPHSTTSVTLRAQP